MRKLLLRKLRQFNVRMRRFLLRASLFVIAIALATLVVTGLIYVIEPLRVFVLKGLLHEEDFNILILKVWGLGVIVTVVGWLVWRVLCIRLRAY